MAASVALVMRGNAPARAPRWRRLLRWPSRVRPQSSFRREFRSLVEHPNASIASPTRGRRIFEKTGSLAGGSDERANSPRARWVRPRLGGGHRWLRESCRSRRSEGVCMRRCERQGDRSGALGVAVQSAHASPLGRSGRRRRNSGDGGAASIDKAIAPLDQLVTGAVPPGNPPEVREVLADTYARLAELRARRGDFERADKDVTSGLGFAPEKTYFHGHLLEVRGLIYDKLIRVSRRPARAQRPRLRDRRRCRQASRQCGCKTK